MSNVFKKNERKHKTKHFGSSLWKYIYFSMKQSFSDLVTANEFCDHGYLDKLKEQIFHCKKEDILNIKRKVEVMRNCVNGGKFGKARIIFHEIAGIVNDSQLQKLAE